MKQPVFDESLIKEQLYPFNLTRRVSDIRVGIRTIAEKWAAIPDLPSDLILPANLLPSDDVLKLIKSGLFNPSALPDTAKQITHPWHIVQLNNWALHQDFASITSGRQSQPIPGSVQGINASSIFIEEGAQLNYCILNASEGPIYIGKNTEIMEGSMIRGPFALCEGSIVKMGAKIYGATTIGPYSIVGGEIKNTVIFGYSNKAHDGYLGDSVIGEWCNLGAGTSNSNLKNNADEVKVWRPHLKTFISAGVKCGLIMGDYSRSAINTSFNTGTVVGVCANVFTEGLTPKYIPDFSWGGKDLARYEFEKALRDIANWKKLKHQTLTDAEIKQLKHIFDQN